MLIDTLDIATENGLVRIGGENGGGDGKRHSLRVDWGNNNY
jgi:hypothetical protein